MEDNQTFCSVCFLDHSRVNSKSSHGALLLVEENQNCVPICYLVLPCIESNSSYDPKTHQNGLFYWNNWTNIKAILTNILFVVIYIKNTMTKYIPIWPYSPNLGQNIEIGYPHFPFLMHSLAHTIIGLWLVFKAIERTNAVFIDIQWYQNRDPCYILRNYKSSITVLPALIEEICTK